MTSHEEKRKIAARVVARSWRDPEYYDRLRTNPRDALQEEGYSVPEGTRVEVHETTPDVMHVVLHPKPSDLDLTDEDLSNPDRVGPMLTTVTLC
jgi:hypothetical protein